MAEKEDFYHELDTKTKRSFCSCQTLAIGFILLAIALAVGLVQVGKKITTAVVPPRKVTGTVDDASKLQERFDTLNKTPGASTSIAITEQELTSLLVEAVAKNPQIPLRNVQVEVEPSEVIVNGTLTQWLNSTVRMSLLPKVIDNKLELELTKIQAGTLAVPPVITEKIAEGFKGLLMQTTNSIQGVAFKSVQLEQGRLTISGTITSPPQ